MRSKAERDGVVKDPDMLLQGVGNLMEYYEQLDAADAAGRGNRRQQRQPQFSKGDDGR